MTIELLNSLQNPYDYILNSACVVDLKKNLSVLVLFKTKAAGIFKDTFKRVNFKCVILEKCKISGNSGGMETVG